MEKKFDWGHVHKTPDGKRGITERELAEIALVLLREKISKEHLYPNKVREILANAGKLGLDSKKAVLAYEILIRESVDGMFSKK